MGIRLSNESEHGSQGPSAYAALFAWQSRDNFAPATEFSLELSGTVQKSIETFSESPARRVRTSARRETSFQRRREDLCATQF
jgi:hypothetical protein